MFGSDGSVDVVVKTPSLTSVQVAQIADITSRHADVDIKDIYVRQSFKNRFKEYILFNYFLIILISQF